MKKLLFPLFGIFLGLMASCNDKAGTSLPPQFAHIDSIKIDNPPATMRLLDSIGMPAGGRERAVWCYAYAKARCLYHVEQSDSLIDVAYDYFMKHGTLIEQKLVLSIKGSVYFDRRDRDKSIEFHLRALDVARQAKDTLGMIQANHNLGTIYIYYAEHVDRAAEYYRKCLGLVEAARDSSWMGVANLCMGRLYQEPKGASRWEEGVRYYRTGIECSRLQGEEWEVVAGLGELASLYTKNGKPLEALKCLNESEPISLRLQPNFTAPLYSTLMNTYFEADMPDSAMVYARLLLEQNKEPLYQNSVYIALYNECLRHKNYEKAVSYVDSIFNYQEKMHNESLSQKIVEAEAKYNQQKVINEKNQLKMEKDRTILIALIVLSVLLLGIVVLVFVYQRLLRRRADELRRKTLRLHENELEIRRNEEHMNNLKMQIEESLQLQEQWDEHQQQLDELKRLNETLRNENTTLQTDIHRTSSTLQKKEAGLGLLVNRLSDENRRLQEREQFLCTQVVERTELLHRLKTSPKYIEDSVWTKVYEALDVLFDDFTSRLSQAIPSLSEGELQIACLVKLRISVGDMATLLGISPASVSQRKQRLKTRILQVPGRQADEIITLDSWIMEF